MNKSFFKELFRVLVEQDIEIAPPAGGRLPILLSGQLVCRVQADAMLCIASGDLMTPRGRRAPPQGRTHCRNGL